MKQQLNELLDRIQTLQEEVEEEYRQRREEFDCAAAPNWPTNSCASSGATRSACCASWSVRGCWWRSRHR
jgi:hypothetical protein